MLKYYTLALLMCTLFAIACNMDSGIMADEPDIDTELRLILEEKGGSLDAYMQPESDDYDNIPQDPKNRLTRTKVQLGKLLFHETALAISSKHPESNNTYSCASCHHAEAGFQANIPQGIGDGGLGFGHRGEGRILNPLFTNEIVDVQPIRTPAALNVAFQDLMLWNGQFGAGGANIGTEAEWTSGTPIAKNLFGFQGVETQAIAGLDVHRFGLSINEEFITETEYKGLFDLAFHHLPEENRYNAINAGLAIAAYERTLLANESPFQRWLEGDLAAMSKNEKEGAFIFFKNGCGDCHNGPALNSMEFHAYGMNDLCDNKASINTSIDDGANLGRGGFTKVDAEKYQFKVPQLYNLTDSPFFGHGSSFTSVEEVIRYKNAGSPENSRVPISYLSAEFKPLGLSENEILLMTEFIEKSLYDPNLSRYNPTALPSGNCFPNNDVLSRVELDCI